MKYAHRYQLYANRVISHQNNNTELWIRWGFAGGLAFGGFSLGLFTHINDTDNLLFGTVKKTFLGSSICAALGAGLAVSSPIWLPVALYGVAPICAITCVCLPINLLRRRRRKMN